MARKKVSQAQTQGQYLVVKHTGRGGGAVHTFAPPPNSELEGFAVRPYSWETVPLEWQNNQRLRQAVEAGIISLLVVDTPPPQPNFDIAPQFLDLLEPATVAIAQLLCAGDYTPQLQGIVKLHEHIGTAGLPQRGSRVTVHYLKTKHRPWLEAVLELEQRWKNRKELIADLLAGLTKIEKM
jgi:hypothetical protein